MAVVGVVVLAVVVWCVASVLVAVVVSGVITRANRDAELQQQDFERGAVDTPHRRIKYGNVIQARKLLVLTSDRSRGRRWR